MASPGGKTYSYGPHAEQRLRVTLPPRGLKKVRVWRERERRRLRGRAGAGCEGDRLFVSAGKIQIAENRRKHVGTFEHDSTCQTTVDFDRLYMMT